MFPALLFCNIFMKISVSNIVRLLVASLPFLFCVWGYVLYENTLVPFWFPVWMAFAFGVFTLSFRDRWRLLTCTSDKILNTLCHFYMIPSCGYILFLGMNTYLADVSSEYKETVIVRSKSVSVHRKTRRVGKHRYVADGEWRNYYLHIVLEDGTEKSVPVSLSEYNRTRENDKKEIRLCKGALGFPIRVR